MTVNSLFFLVFLAGIYLFYYVVFPVKYRWLVLLAASVIFYIQACAASPVYVFLSAMCIWIAGMLMETQEKIKKKIILAAAVVFNLGLLLVLKYSGFFTAPLGISYYTLIAVGYVADVYKGKVQAQKNPARLLLFLMYFPQMTQGPVNRYQPMAAQLYEGHRMGYHNLSYGCQRILWGFFKKLVIADNLHPAMQSLFDGYETLGGVSCALACIYMTVWMYADFSGYMDIVAGTSELFGIHIAENFKRPFFSKSLAEYWRRWHITLCAWFRDYMFYPLAISSAAVRFGKFGRKHFGVRIGKLFPSLFALLFVWTCTGLWHEPNWRYVLWGAANGFFIMGAMVMQPYFDAWKKAFRIPVKSRGWQIFCMVRTFLLVCLLKVFPGPKDTAAMAGVIRKIFTDIRLPGGWDEVLPGIGKGDAMCLGFAVLIVFAVDVIQEKQPVRDLLAQKYTLVRWICYLGVLAMILLFGQFNVSMTGGFAYAQF
ncbi:MAG: MBOAT family O-acyltransferase [Eubacteriales bacterium]|nr:MBOAT family O-acyltransferase [Eubacteriales bacterium]